MPNQNCYNSKELIWKMCDIENHSSFIDLQTSLDTRCGRWGVQLKCKKKSRLIKHSKGSYISISYREKGFSKIYLVYFNCCFIKFRHLVILDWVYFWINYICNWISKQCFVTQHFMPKDTCGCFPRPVLQPEVETLVDIC